MHQKTNARFTYKMFRWNMMNILRLFIAACALLGVVGENTNNGDPI